MNGRGRGLVGGRGRGRGQQGGIRGRGRGKGGFDQGHNTEWKKKTTSSRG